MPMGIKSLMQASCCRDCRHLKPLVGCHQLVFVFTRVCKNEKLEKTSLYSWPELLQTTVNRIHICQVTSVISKSTLPLIGISQVELKEVTCAAMIRSENIPFFQIAIANGENCGAWQHGRAAVNTFRHSSAAKRRGHVLMYMMYRVSPKKTSVKRAIRDCALQQSRSPSQTDLRHSMTVAPKPLSD